MFANIFVDKCKLFRALDNIFTAMIFPTMGKTSHVIHGIMNMTHHVYRNPHINQDTLIIMALSTSTNNRHNIWH